MTQNPNPNNSTAKYTPDALYKLLPAVYRQRDAAVGSPLLGLLTVISEQVGILEDDISQLYENWFIETCDSWVVPYIGDLLGTKLAFTNTTVANSINRRSFVANTISYRRRKGTPLVLENLARDITGWGAKAVEFFQLLQTTQCINHLRTNSTSVNIRDMVPLQFINTPFDSIMHTVEVRNISTGQGLYNIPNIGIFLCRLEALPVVNAPAVPLNPGDYRFYFNVLGIDTQLFNNPVTENEILQTAQVKSPRPIKRFDLSNDLINHLEEYYSDYDEEKSIKITANSAKKSSNDIYMCDLTNWASKDFVQPKNYIAIDPVLGRIAFPSSDNIPTDVHVSYYYGFSGEVGGGFYQRPLISLPNAEYIEVKKKGNFTSIQAAFNNWNQAANPEALLEISDSEIYSDPINLTLLPSSKLMIRATQEMRPLINPPNAVTISVQDSSITPQSSIAFNGLLLDQDIRVGAAAIWGFSP